MNKLIYKTSVKFFISSLILLFVSILFKLIGIQQADLILNISCSILLMSLIFVMLRYKIVREKKNFKID